MNDNNLNSTIMTKKEEKEIKERRNRLQKARNVNYREFITRQLDVAAEVAKEQITTYSTELKLSDYKHAMSVLLRIAADRLNKLAEVK